MNKIKLGEIATIEISNVDKKIKEKEINVKLCNFVDVYNNWAITKEKIFQFLNASASKKEIEKFSLKKGQVAITKDSETRNDIGMSTYIADTLENILLGYHCILITINNTEILNGKYLNAFLNSKQIRKYFENQASGSGQRYTLTNNVVSDIEIPLLDIKKQKLIGNIFSYIDRKIELNNKINTELEAMAKTIYDYWFLQFEFPNEEGKPYKSSGGKMVWNEELKREIPEGWEINKLGNIFSFIKGKNPDSLSDEKNSYNSYPYINIEAATGGKMQFCNGKSMILSDGETIMVMDGAASGEIYVGNSGVLGSTFSKLMPKDEKISNSLIYQILGKIKPIYKKANIGSTVPHANKSFIENIQIALPKNVHYFSKFFDEIYLKININKKENRELTSLKEFLLPLLMNEQVKFIDRQ